MNSFSSSSGFGVRLEGSVRSMVKGIIRVFVLVNPGSADEGKEWAWELVMGIGVREVRFT